MVPSRLHPGSRPHCVNKSASSNLNTRPRKKRNDVTGRELTEQVFVAGGFNNWSETATPLEMQDDGTFLVDVKLPWGERQAYKYVLDGEWMVREDEDKEWGESGERSKMLRGSVG